jgi:hypothetical protein
MMSCCKSVLQESSLGTIRGTHASQSTSSPQSEWAKLPKACASTLTSCNNKLQPSRCHRLNRSQTQIVFLLIRLTVHAHGLYRELHLAVLQTLAATGVTLPNPVLLAGVRLDLHGALLETPAAVVHHTLVRLPIRRLRLHVGQLPVSLAYLALDLRLVSAAGTARRRRLVKHAGDEILVRMFQEGQLALRQLQPRREGVGDIPLPDLDRQLRRDRRAAGGIVVRDRDLPSGEGDKGGHISVRVARFWERNIGDYKAD